MIRIDHGGFTLIHEPIIRLVVDMENKHTFEELTMMQSLPLSVKVSLSVQRIRDWYREYQGDVYVSISGGKDSQVLSHLVRSIYPDVPLVFVNTGLEADSVRKKGYELADEVLKPKKDFVRIITEYGYPVMSKEVSQKIFEARRNPDGACARRFNENDEHNIKYPSFSMVAYKWLLDAPFRIGNGCCNASKKQPAKTYEHDTGRKPFVGTMAEESRLRTTKWMRLGCNAYDVNRPVSNPLSFWTEQDILLYILKNKLSIADAYGDIVYQDKDGFLYENPLITEGMFLTTSKAKRTGCVFCMFGISYDKEKFLRLKEEEPMKYDYVMRGGRFDEQGMWIPDKGLGYRFVIDWLNEHGNMGIKY